MLKCAEQSPRICDDGTIRWYAGDTFNLELEFVFTDDDDNEIPVDPTDKLTLCFTDEVYGATVHECEVVGTNRLNILVDQEVTKKFKVGNYRYCVRRCSNFTTTLIRLNKVVVE